MPETFLFEELTWPEVAALPRSTPLILPLGCLPNPGDLAFVQHAAQPVGILPQIPYGLPGSALEVRQDVFSRLVRNLLSNLLEDGFTDVRLAGPPDLDLGADLLVMPACVEPSLQPRLPAGEHGEVMLLPVGHTEQHGYHAPLSTDSLIIDAITRGTAAACPGQAFAMPVFPYGVSTHRRSFPGTFNVGGREFEDFWLAVVDALVGAGFSRFYLLSGHGGNSSFLVNVVKYAGEKYPLIFCATAFLYLSGLDGIAALNEKRESGLGGMGHACELETSLILHLRPDLVHLERAVDETDFITTRNYYMDWIEGGALTANPPWEDDTRTGAYGAGSLGTAEKGAFWLKAAIAEKVEHVAEIQEQYRRRRERKNKSS